MAHTENRIFPAMALVLALVATTLVPWAGTGATVPSNERTLTNTAGHPGESTSDAGLAVSIVPGGALLLPDQSQAFVGEITKNSGAYWGFTWTWSLSNNPAGSLVDVQGPGATFLAGGVAAPTNVYVTVNLTAFDFFHADAIVSVGDTVLVQVLPPLVVGSLGASPNPTTPGFQVLLSTDVSGGLPPFTASWDFGDGNSAVQSTLQDGSLAVHHAFPAGTFTPSVTVTDADQETTMVSVLSTLVVASTLTASISAPSHGDVGQTVDIVGTVSGGMPPYQYAWSDSAGDSSLSPDSWALPLGHAGTLTIDLTVTDNLGKMVSAPVATIVVSPSPQLSLSSDVSKVDVGTPFPLVLTITGGSAPYQLSWADPAEAASYSSSESVPGAYSTPYSFATPGSIVIQATLTDAEGESSSVDELLGTVEPVPTIELTLSPGSPTVGDPIYLTATVAEGVAPYDYSFSFSGPVNSTSPLSGTLGTPGAITWVGALPSTLPVVATVQVSDTSGGSGRATMVFGAADPLQATLSLAPVRGEVGRPVTADLVIEGGVAPYSYALSGSDGEAATGTLPAPGASAIPLVPLVAGNLTFSVQVSDTDGRSTIASAQLPVRAPFGVELSWTPSSVDAGQTIDVEILPSGGWAPFSGSFTSPDGSVVQLNSLTGDTNLSVTLPQSGAELLSVDLTDAVGATAGRTVSVPVGSLPTATLAVSPSTTEVGLPVIFSTSVEGGTPPYSVRIDFGDGSSATGDAVAHAYTTAGTYAANATVRDAAGAASSTGVITVIVVPQPTVLASTSVPGGDIGLGVPFASAVSFGEAPYSYRWTFGDGGVSADADPTHVYTVEGLYRIQLTITDSLGVSATSNLLNVTVGEPAALDLAANRTTFDAGEPVLFSATAIGGAPPPMILMDFGDGSSAWGSTASHAFATAGIYQVSATLTDGAGGTARASITVNVSAAPTPNPVQVVPGIGEVGADITLTEEPNGGVGPYHYTWTLGPTQVSGTGDDSWSFVTGTAGTFTGTVEITDVTGLSSVASFSFRVVPHLAVNLTALGQSGEVGIPVSVQAVLSGGAGPFTLDWEVSPYSDETGSASTVIVVDPAVPGTLGISLSISDALGSTALASVSLPIAPPLRLSIPLGGLAADVGMPVALPVVSSGGIGPIELSVATPFAPPQPGATVVFPNLGTYPVVVSATDANGARAWVTENVTVSPPLSLSLVSDPLVVPVGEPQTFAATIEGGSAPFVEGWNAPGVGGAEGACLNLTLPHPGTFELVFSVRDATGATEVTSLNLTAVDDHLALALNTSQVLGVTPFAPRIMLNVTGGSGETGITVAMNGGEVADLVSSGLGTTWTYEPPLVGPGTYALTARAVDALGQVKNASLLLTACAPLGMPVLPTGGGFATAGIPLELASTAPPEDCPSATVDPTWWGTGVLSGTGPSASFLENRSGIVTDHLSTVLRLVGGGVLENLTIPWTIDVRPAAADEVRPSLGPGEGIAGDNLSLIFETVDAFGNENVSVNGSVVLTPATPGLAVLTSPLVEGQASFLLHATQAGWENYSTGTPFGPGPSVDVPWKANAERAVLRVLTATTLEKGLVVTVSVRDVYGNPLSNVSVEAIAPGYAPVFANATGGTATLEIPGAANAASITIEGPGGSTTTDVLAAPADPPDSSFVSFVAAAGLFATAIALGLLWVRRRASGRPSAEKAQEILRDLVTRWPGEDRESLLAMAEEQHLTAEEAAQGLANLERTGSVEKRTDEEGLERWSLSSKATDHADKGAPEGNGPEAGVTP